MAEEESKVITLPEGRLIYHNLFIKDQFNEQATPQYKIEMAFDKGVLNDFYNKCLDAAVAKWGAGADEDKNLIVPIKDGEARAAKRESAGKSGDAYIGKEVIRATSIFDRHGEDGPGGMAVYDLDLTPILITNQEAVYQGCFGEAAVTIGTYVDSTTGANALKLYLSAFHKTRDGDRLVAQTDHSTYFKPIGRPVNSGAAPGEGRRQRAG